ncbi:MAG: hypothetical protein E7555_10485 [Ruminococcaceae bacterium]|nr:hypothetical protein [Oscillospiraceae bacterium]
MNLWQTFEMGKNQSFENQEIIFHYEKGIDYELKKLYHSFGKWLKSNYVFPVRINIYILNCEKIRLRNGQMAYGSFRWFPHKTPIIKIPSAVEKGLLNDYTIDEIHEQILSSLVHELTHYYQWILNLEQSNSLSERQANYYRYRIIEKYYNR